MKVVVYDLNKTLYRESSKDEFFKFICYKRNYKILNLIELGWYKFMGKLRLITKTEFKENFYNYLKGLDPQTVKKYARQFWDMEYPEKFRSYMIDDIKKFHDAGIKVYVITGGFEVYTKYLEELLPVKILGTRTEYENGNYKVIGKACNDQEKLKRLGEDTNGNYQIIEAYSDDKEEILFNAEKGYFLNDDKLELVTESEKH
ncbi:HAD family hydrolase [Christiangramia sediminis]|uniref:Haloacid dehalogenase-like hydrolase n=1 Tax=Christiangramia sediminis TaxID=2881336 RepID=A0A9X1LKB0_9FLAO|nr:HAD family hydrolase [Christiangramia sediminis]MCB7481943.1 haloacid dehalogenase-like hydrolase [Christiangramia sediminis]